MEFVITPLVITSIEISVIACRNKRFLSIEMKRVAMMKWNERRHDEDIGSGQWTGRLYL